MPARKDKGGTVSTRHGWQARCACGALSRETFQARHTRMVTPDGFVLHDRSVKCPACAVTVRACREGTLRRAVLASDEAYTFDYAAHGSQFWVSVSFTGLVVSPDSDPRTMIHPDLADLPAPVRAVVLDVRAIMDGKHTRADKRRDAKWTREKAEWARKSAEWKVRIAKLDAQVAAGKARVERAQASAREREETEAAARELAARAVQQDDYTKETR